MRILFDQGTPAPLRRALADHSVSTTFEMGWAGLDNGALLKAAEHETTCDLPGVLRAISLNNTVDISRTYDNPDMGRLRPDCADPLPFKTPEAPKGR